jgi:putative DNA primase/helicase
VKDPLAVWRYGTLAEHWDWLVKRNERGAGIYVTINETDGKGGKKTNIIRIRALFEDLDGSPLAPVVNAKVKPHIIVQSSPGRFQTYKCFTGRMPLRVFEPLQKALANRFNGDPSVHDLSRVMRLPGFVHRKEKDKPFLSHIVAINGHKPHRASLLLKTFRPPKEIKQDRPQQPGQPAQPSHDDDELRQQWKKLNTEAIRRYADWVPDIFARADKTSAGGYRVTSVELGRDNEEDLSFHPDGIVDWGVHDLGDARRGRRTPVDIVEQYLHKDFKDAVHWLAQKLGFDPQDYLPKPKPKPKPNEQAEIERLAKLSDIQYDRERKDAAEKLGMRVSTLDKLVAKKRGPAPGDGGLEDKVALEFSAKYATDMRYVHLWGKWFRWDDVRWASEDTLYAFHLARELCRKAEDADHKTVAAVTALARTDRRQAALTSQWDADPWLLGTPKGTVDLRTGKLFAPRPTDYITKITSVAPSDEPPRDGCPLWLDFLNRVTDGNEALQDYLQRSCGYCLTGITTEDALFFHYGKGGNGKSVFLDTISGILNDYHEAADMELFVVTHGERHPTDLASLRGARLVTAVETEEGKRWAEAKLKQMTGGDPIKARFMRQDFFTYIPQFKLMFAGNPKPTIRSVDVAISRRFHLVPWLVTIPENERNKNLSDDLKAEWPGILRWMIEGCLAWKKDALLKPPQIVTDATKEYLESQDTVQNFFDDCCVIAKNEYDTFEHIWDGYVDWCEDCREFIGTKKTFGQKLKDKGFQTIQYGADRALTYVGIRCIRENAKKLKEERLKEERLKEERLKEETTRRSPDENARAASPNNDKPPPLMPCAHCGRADGSVYQMNDLARGTSFDPAWGTPNDCPNVYLHEECAQPFFAARVNGQRAPEAAPARSPLTSGRARELYAIAIDWIAGQNAAGRSFKTADVENELRSIVREEVPPDEVEAAITQVLDLLFAV